MSKKTLIILLGSACVGKTTIETKMINDMGCCPVTIITTRNERRDDPPHYRFVSLDAFEMLDNLDFVLQTSISLYGYVVNDAPVSVVSLISAKDVDELIEAVSVRCNLEVVVIKINATDKEMSECFKLRNMKDTKERINESKIGSCQIDYEYHRDDAIIKIEEIVKKML